MKLTKDQLCVYIENEAQLEEARNILSNHNEEIDYGEFHLLKGKWIHCNSLKKWRLDGKWRIGYSERQQITLQELETILNEVK